MKDNKMIGYVGTYTKGESKGIYSFALADEKMTDVKLAATIENPTYLTISDDNKFLISVMKKGDEGGVASYEVDSNTGALHMVNSQLTAGSPPCHVSTDQDSKCILTANYHKGTIESYLSVGGRLQPPASVIAHHGSGPDERQEKPHTHFAGFTPDEKYAIAVDLGIDQVISYENREGLLQEKAVFTAKPGSGPRHIVFHPNGKWAYVMTELSSEIITLSYDSENGSFAEVQTISTIPSDFIDNNQGSAIHISSDGRFIYAGNRGHDSIAVYAVDTANGSINFLEHTSTYGNWPRDFVLDPTEAYVIASNQNSGTLVLYARDAVTGKLSLLQKDIVVPDPVCVKFLHI
ncbi:lactonase family protein [Cytobacillus purgationiresistens]|uniref:6-phosphogluconolactonase n=1 Tax=Cytobacillus purgationiresistens TaxID=863449 RepID=A0ABU0AH19_9BACI|nr:lactonase family protein [Cytobacillus purgationiresistens]MDQ0270556.1 6-phosphogluconolactonase [Cytobacillus purgationiresistens]